MHLAKRYSAFFLFLFANSFLYSNDPIVVDSDFTTLRLDPFAYVWEDTSKSFHIEDILERQPLFTMNESPSLNFAYANSFFWIRFDLVNTDPVPINIILEVDNPHINKLQLYTIRDSLLTRSILTGDNIRFQQRPIKHPHFIFPLVLPPNDTMTYYLWIDKHGEQIQAPLRLMTLAEYNSYNSRIHLFWASMLGITFVFSLLSFAIFVFNPQKLSFYFWAYTFGVFWFNISHTGLAFQFIWPELTWWQSAARPTCAFIMYIFALLFTSSFFNLRQKNKFIYILFILLISALAFLLISLWSQNPAFGLFEHYWYHPVYYEGDRLLLFSKLLSPIIMLALIVIISVGILRPLRKVENYTDLLNFSNLVNLNSLIIKRIKFIKSLRFSKLGFSEWPQY